MFDLESHGEDWADETVNGMTTEMERIKPSDFIEQTRYLPSSVTPRPGPFSFDVAPMWREIVDCFDLYSPVREVNVRKGVQVMYTTNLENIFLYFMAHIKTVPMMFMTADGELAKARIENNFTPMINQSDLAHLIKSSDENNTRKTGKTDKHIQWEGGGYMIPFGAKNADKMRSFSIMIMLKDEIDAWPDTVGKDGDPDSLSDDRTSAYTARRKIFRGSTPLIRGMSKIDKQYYRGDQRKYFVRCLSCGFPQTLVFNKVIEETGVIYGLTWETENGILIPESVRYACQNCGHGHHEHDKLKLFNPDNGAEWRPTGTPISKDIRSYDLSALYSPVGFQPWSKAVSLWLEAWDVENNRPRDLGKLQVFYNNVLGRSYEVRGSKLKFVHVSPHRRSAYTFGTVPNSHAVRHTGGKVMIMVCTVDVHKDNLAVATWGWCRDRRLYLVDYWRFEGDTENTDNVDTWGKLHDLIDGSGDGYIADDGTRYKLELTLIDAQYRTDQVLAFCGQYAQGVAPIRGQDTPPKSAAIREFSEYKTKFGTRGYGITVDLYKDRWSAALRRQWDEQSPQPANCFNAPIDITDKQLKELTVETKREKIQKGTGKRVGFEWYRPPGSDNELWDLLIYSNAALDLIAWDICRNQLEMDVVNWQAFWDLCESNKLFYVDG